MRLFCGLELLLSGICLLIGVLVAWIDEFDFKKAIKVFLTLEIPAMIIVAGLMLSCGA